MSYVIVKRKGWHEVWFTPYAESVLHNFPVYERRVAKFRLAGHAIAYAEEMEMQS